MRVVDADPQILKQCKITLSDTSTPQLRTDAIAWVMAQKGHKRELFAFISVERSDGLQWYYPERWWDSSSLRKKNLS